MYCTLLFRGIILSCTYNCSVCFCCCFFHKVTQFIKLPLFFSILLMLLRNIPCLSHAIRPSIAIYGKSFGKLKLRKWPGERKFLSTKKEKKTEKKVCTMLHNSIYCWAHGLHLEWPKWQVSQLAIIEGIHVLLQGLTHEQLMRKSKKLRKVNLDCKPLPAVFKLIQLLHDCQTQVTKLVTANSVTKVYFTYQSN